MKMETYCRRAFATPAKLATSRAVQERICRFVGCGPALEYKGALRMKFGMRVRGGLLAALIMFVAPVVASLAALTVASPANAVETISSIEVVGNRRVEVETIRSYFKSGAGGA